MAAEDSVVLCSPADEMEAQAVLALLAQHAIPCRLEPRAVTLYPTVLGRSDVLRVRRSDLARAQDLLEAWQDAGRAADGEALDALALADGGVTRARRTERMLEQQRELFAHHGPVSWERGVPPVLIAVGLFGALEELWSGTHAARPTVLLLWVGCVIVGATLAHPSAGLRDAALRRSMAALWELDGAARAGDCQRALALCEHLLSTLPRGICPYLFVNSLVNHLITCGRYREALALPEQWPEPARTRGAEVDREHALMTELNCIEALYNLGRLQEARERLDALPSGDDFAVVEAGRALQRGWLAALEGHGEVALAELEGLDEQAVEADYRAELWFARARAWLACGKPAEAREATEAGLALSRRAASERNALFMLAHVARAAGEREQAAELFAEGAEHPYRGQGGDALLAWGDTERELERPERAHGAWSLVLERDPESAAAEQARARLAAAGS